MSAAPAPARARPIAAALGDAAARLEAAGIPTARADAECLLGQVLGTSRLGLYTAGAAPLPDRARERFEALVARRLGHEPLQYLLGTAEFCGLSIAVGPGVFIPRPETEELVARALGLPLPASALVLDLCAGSGAIACALASRRPGWTVCAVERAPTALGYARANVARHGLGERVHVAEGDLFEPLWGAVAPGAVDLIVANPPYLAAAAVPALPVEVREWEPRAALDGGAGGLGVIRRLVADSPRWLRAGGTLLAEVGEDHGAAVAALVRADRRYAAGAVHRDFRGCDRILEARRG
jgi:release factor glutamine methyltransferase